MQRVTIGLGLFSFLISSGSGFFFFLNKCNKHLSLSFKRPNKAWTFLCKPMNFTLSCAGFFMQCFVFFICAQKWPPAVTDIFTVANSGLALFFP